MDDPSEGALVQEAKRGSVEAFAELARRTQERIYRVIIALTRNSQDAADLTQDVYLAAFRSLPGFREKSSFYTWVYRIAVNLTLNFLKRKAREKGREEFDDGRISRRESPAADIGPEGRTARRELEERLEEAIDSLPLPFKAAFRLVVGQGLSHAEAAGALGCSENTVSWRMHKARKMLQARLGPFLREVDHEM